MRLSCDPNEILWYAMSSPFRREMKAKALLDAHHIENFIPMKKRQEIRDGEIVTWEEPAIHNFVFVHDSYNGIMKVKKGLDIRKRLRVYTIVVFSFIRTFAPSF